MAKKEQIFRKYSAEFKIGVIMDMRENRLGYRETADGCVLLGYSAGDTGDECCLNRQCIRKIPLSEI